MRRFIIAVTAGCVLGGLARAAPFAEANCYVDGFETPVRCISVTVPLDYAAPHSETTKITAAIVPAVTARPAGDPLFVLAGGPGQAATGMGPWLDSAFRPARRARDIVLFDIRGTGFSGALMCPFSLTADADAPGQFRRDAGACAKIHGARAKFHSSLEIVEDIEWFRRALGYSKINLWGGSFGTRIAQHYVRRYGAHVRAVVLDAATPANESIFATAPLYGQQALDRLFADCAADAACNAAFPRLRADFDALVRRAEAAPIPVEASDPRDGRVRRLSVDRDGVVGLVRGALYAGVTRGVVPYAITQGANGDMKPLIALGAATSEWSAETMALGSMLSIVCAEDLARSLRGDQAKNAFGFMGDSYVRLFGAGCSVWPYSEVPNEMGQAFSSCVPALAISGEADPVTPPASGEVTLKMFATRVHAIVPHGFHTNSSNRCVADIIGSFLADPERGGRDHACLKRARRPTFLVTPTM